MDSVHCSSGHFARAHENPEHGTCHDGGRQHGMMLQAAQHIRWHCLWLQGQNTQKLFWHHSPRFVLSLSACSIFVTVVCKGLAGKRIPTNPSVSTQIHMQHRFSSRQCGSRKILQMLEQNFFFQWGIFMMEIITSLIYIPPSRWDAALQGHPRHHCHYHRIQRGNMGEWRALTLLCKKIITKGTGLARPKGLWVLPGVWERGIGNDCIWTDVPFHLWARHCRTS